MFGWHPEVDKREKWHRHDWKAVDKWMIHFAASYESVFRLTACGQITKEQRVEVTRGALLGIYLSFLRADATYSFISGVLEMRSETRQWVAVRGADSLIKYGLIGKCLSSYCADLWYTYKVKEITLRKGNTWWNHPRRLNRTIIEVLFHGSVFQYT